LGNALIVSVEVPDPTTGLGLKELFVLDGNPDTLSCTLPLKPFTPVIVTVYFVDELDFIVCDDGETAIEKSVGALTTNVAGTL
jgi:hypothetical protein